jgi:crotonobetainyl-CoA:carnitine CoA-transferase CaiB-like acyl-CoA transferase
MTDLLQGLTIGIDGDARTLRYAARCLGDLGARVVARAGGDDEVDRLWLGELPPPADGGVVDLLLTDGTPATGPWQSRLRVAYTPTSSQAERANERFGERELSAVGCLAVAVGEPDQPPLPLPDGTLDALIGTHLAAAAVAALLEGTEHTEIAGADVVAWAVATNIHLYRPYGVPWHRDGRRAAGSGSCYPWALFEAADGPYCLIGRTDKDWRTLVAMMGDPAWASDPRFADPRVIARHHAEEVDGHVGSWIGRHTRQELNDIMMRHGFPGAPVLQPEEVLEQPSIADRWRTASSAGRPVRAPGRSFDVVASGGGQDDRPLAGLLVLDLAWVWSGPAVSVALADLGATVIKVESAGRPDNTRLRGAPIDPVVLEGAPLREVAPYFHALNRGKRSVSLDLKTDEGRAVLRQLADRADVIVENLTAGVMDRWGIAPEVLHETNPGCVFVSMRGYRDHPTTRGLRAYAPVLSSGAGFEAMVAYPGEAPVGAMSVAYSDALAASQALLLVLSGLHARRAHGTGSGITLSQFDAAVMANGRNLVAAQLDGRRDGLRPLDDLEDLVVTGPDLASSPWLSPDLLGPIRPRWVGPVQVARLPWRRDGELPALRSAAPELGAHTDQELRRLGLSDARLAQLRAAGALT